MKASFWKELSAKILYFFCGFLSLPVFREIFFTNATEICYTVTMNIWTSMKTKLRERAYLRRKKKHGVSFPLYCKLHGVKRGEYQGALAQSREKDELQLVHSPTPEYPYNVYAYSVPLNRVLGYLQAELSKRLVKVFGKGFCRDGVIENLTGGERAGYKYFGCNIRVLETMTHMQNCEDFSHLYGA